MGNDASIDLTRLSSTMRTIEIAERRERKECTVAGSNLLKEILEIMQKNNYIGSFESMRDQNDMSGLP